MKVFKTCLLLLLAAALLLPLAPLASASEPEPESGDARFAGKSFEEIMEDFFAAHGTNSARVAAGWCNTVSGEEQYYNGDQYMVSGSMYKVPMNMIFTEKVYNGELGWNSFVGGYRYEYCLHATIVDSNNDVARGMWEYLGGYQPYRHLLAPYMGEDPDTVDEKFYENNFSTPRQMIYALKLLQTESERFPRLIDEMKLAEPNKYFKSHQHSYEMGHKYGYYAEGARLYLNDCAIIYTEEPICIVIFTDTIADPYRVLADFCDLMIDYTEYTTPLRRERERLEAEAAALAALATPEPSEAPAGSGTSVPSAGQSATGAPAVTPAPTPAGETEAAGLGFGRALCAVLAAAAVLFFLVCAAAKARRGALRFGWALLAILLAAAALGLCLLPETAEKPLSAAPAADEPELDGAQETVSAFFDAVCAGDYALACRKLSGVSTLGLENQPAGEDAAALWRALAEHRSYRLYGEARAVSGGAEQQLLFTTLDLDALSQALRAATEARVEALAAALPAEEIYDGEGGYLESFTERAYREALDETLARAEDFEALRALNIRLVRSGKSWLIEPDTALYAALTGGAVG